MFGPEGFLQIPFNFQPKTAILFFRGALGLHFDPIDYLNKSSSPLSTKKSSPSPGQINSSVTSPPTSPLTHTSSLDEHISQFLDELDPTATQNIENLLTQVEKLFPDISQTRNQSKKPIPQWRKDLRSMSWYTSGNPFRYLSKLNKALKKRHKIVTFIQNQLIDPSDHSVQKPKLSAIFDGEQFDLAQLIQHISNLHSSPKHSDIPSIYFQIDVGVRSPLRPSPPISPTPISVYESLPLLQILRTKSCIDSLRKYCIDNEAAALLIVLVHDPHFASQLFEYIPKHLDAPKPRFSSVIAKDPSTGLNGIQLVLPTSTTQSQLHSYLMNSPRKQIPVPNT